MGRVGLVVRTDGQHAMVSASRRGACDGCADADGCSVGSRPDPKTAEVVDAVNPVGARAGDWVEFDLTGHSELAASAVVWGMPLVGLVGGVVIGGGGHQLVGLSQDTAALIGSAVGLALAVVVMRAIDRRVAGSDRLVPRIERVVSRADCPPRTGR